MDEHDSRRDDRRGTASAVAVVPAADPRDAERGTIPRPQDVDAEGDALAVNTSHETAQPPNR